MTGPYQPPGGDINSPFGPSDPNSPFTPSPASGSYSHDETPKDEDEVSPYQGVQYSLEAPPGQPELTAPPQSGPPAYGPTPPPPHMAPSYGPPQPYAPMPPKKSGNNGLLIGGIIAGVVVVLLLAGIVIAAINIGNGGGGSDDPSSGDGDFAQTYTIPGDVCADVDLSSIEAIGAFTTSPTGTSNASSSYGYGSCNGSMGNYDEADYGFFNLNLSTTSSKSSVDADWSSKQSTYLGGCDTSDVSGSWDEGKLGKGTSCDNPITTNKFVLLIRADNLVAVISVDGEENTASQGEEAVKSVADSLLTASKA